MGSEEIAADPGRLDAVVARLTGAPRAEVQRAIAEGLVTVDGSVRQKSFRLSGGERLVVTLPGELEVPPEGPGVPIRRRDEHLVVVVKPAGLPTHPTEGRRTGTLVNRLKGMGLPLSPVGAPLRPGIVHRLDVGTSGLMIVALTIPAHEALAGMMKRHEVDRRYLALVRGLVEHDAFQVDAPLGRRGARITVSAAGGREAATTFEVRERFARATLLEAAPHTGRTHQIRVHLAAIGHPILGDRAYGGAGDDARALGLGRPFLHSWRLVFDHPITGERIELEEPLPPDLAEALRRARGRGRPD
ncbi:MAG: RluA family pseudouridine synthase [Actinobacteria bacterium]|nr:RluA family pseudouridine synthase [Actinomycetota bacterium]